MAKKAAPKLEEPIEKQMWKAAEYKHIVLGLIFLCTFSGAVG